MEGAAGGSRAAETMDTDLLKLPGVVYCEFKKGTCIIRQGDKLDAVYFLISGVCHRKTINKKGDEIIYGVKESGPQGGVNPDFVQSVLGILILYSDGVSSCNFCASVKCCCYKIPKDVFLHYVHDKPAILTRIVQLAMRELRSLAGSLQARQEGESANQLCRLLLKHAARETDGVMRVKGLSNLDISQFLGIHKVTVNRILRALKEERVIDTGRQRVVILDEKLFLEYAEAVRRLDY